MLERTDPPAHSGSRRARILMDQYRKEEEEDQVSESSKRRTQCIACNAMEPREDDDDDDECEECCLKCTSVWLHIVALFIRMLTILRT